MPDGNSVRSAEKSDIDFDFDFEFRDDPLAPAYGLRNGLICSLILWGLIGLVIYWAEISLFDWLAT